MKKAGGLAKKKTLPYTHRQVRILLASLFLALACAAAFAQEAEPSGGTQANSSSSTTDDGDHQNTQRAVPLPYSVYRSGRVTLATGGPPPPGTPVEMICRGGESIETTTDKEGRFSLSWTTADRGAAGPGARIGDARIGRGSAAHERCTVDVPLAGYVSKRASSVSTGSIAQRTRRGGSVGVIVLYPADASAGSIVSITSFEAPGDARKSYERAHKELRGKKPDLDRAVRHLLAAVEAYPDYAAAWSTLGRVLTRQGNHAAAREALQRAISADATFLEPYALLAGLALERNDWASVIQAARKTLELRPGDIQASYYLALGLLGRQELDAAMAAARTVTESEQANAYPRAFHVLGAVHVLRGEYGDASAAFARYIEIEPNSPLAANMRALLVQWRAEGKIDDSRPSSPDNRFIGAL